LHRAFNIVPQSANDTVVVEGNSQALSTGCVFPLIPYQVDGNYRIADIGVDGHGLNAMVQRMTSRRARFVQLGWGGSGWIDPATGGLLSYLYRIPVIKAQYNPNARRNICVVQASIVGVNDADLNSATTVYDYMLSWLNELRSGDQNWTVLVALSNSIPPPGGALEYFYNMVVDNAVALGYACFLSTTTDQISYIIEGSHELIKLYVWDYGTTRYNGHGTTALFALESWNWANAINAALL
jgi:hypothetical protein